MCIPFICMFVGLPSWVCVVNGLVVCWLKHVPKGSLLSVLFQSPALLCPDARVLTWRKGVQVGQKVVGFCASGSRVLMSLILYFVGWVFLMVIHFYVLS